MALKYTPPKFVAPQPPTVARWSVALVSALGALAALLGGLFRRKDEHA
jgi:hypothetical protein